MQQYIYQKKMKFQYFIIILANSMCVCNSHRRYVEYTGVGDQPVSNSKARVACAEDCASNEYLAARVNILTGVCEGLTWDWGSSPQYETGFSYIRKTKTAELYEPALQLEKYRWLFPGTFGVGAWLEFYITMPTGYWEGFIIDILDTAAYSYDVYDAESEVIMVHIVVDKFKESIVFKTWWYGWINREYMSPIPLSDGGTYKITVVPKADIMQIWFDDVEVAQYTHPSDPATAKQLQIKMFSNSALKIDKITFVSI